MSYQEDQNVQLEYSDEELNYDNQYITNEYESIRTYEELNYDNQYITFEYESIRTCEENDFGIFKIEYLVDNYKKIDKKTECNICFEEDYDNSLIQTSCSHIFHKECLNTWFEKKGNCPICRSEFLIKKTSDTIEYLFESILDSKYPNIVSMYFTKKDIISHYCDECNKIITTEMDVDKNIIRYHKKYTNYDLCSECYEKIVKTNEEKEQYVIFYLNKEYNFIHELPNNLNKLYMSKINFLFENKLVKSKELNCDKIVFNNCTITTDLLEIRNSVLRNSIIKVNNMIYIETKIDKISTNSIFENITENNKITNMILFLKITDEKVSFRLSTKCVNIFSNLNNFNNLVSLILENDKIIYVPCILDLKNTRLNTIQLINWSFNSIINYPSTLNRLDLKRAIKNHIELLDLSKCDQLQIVYIDQMDLSIVKFGETENFFNISNLEIIITKSKLRKIIDIPSNTTDLFLEKNNLDENSLKLDKLSLNNINLSYNNFTTIGNLPKTIKNIKIKNNKLDSINLNKFTKLESLDCSNNNIKSYITGSKIRSLDISNNYLTSFNVINRFTNLNLSKNLLNNFYIKNHNYSLDYLNISHNNLTKLDFKDIDIRTIDCSFNKIKQIINFNDTVYLNLSHNPICNLFLPQIKYKYLNIKFKNIKKIKFNINNYENILISKFKFDKNKINNKIINFKNNNSLDSFFMIVNENFNLTLHNISK